MDAERETESPKQSEQPAGMQCPSCGCRHLPVYYTRQRIGKVVRVRKCRNCGRKILTTERVT